MPRWLLARAEAQRAYTRAQRLGFQTRREANAFIDYFRLQGATLPEMMVYAELVRREIPFAYAEYFGDIPFTEEQEKYRPDFTLKEYRIIIRVQGMYWHTRPGDAERDAQQAALLTMLGWKVYDLWENDILKDVHKIIDDIPELQNPTVKGGPEPTLGRPYLQLEGFMARLRKAPMVRREARPKERVPITRGWFPRRKRAPFRIDYIPVRFKGFSEPPEIWPEAEQWWTERTGKTTTWESLSAVQPVASLTREFNQFPPLEGGSISELEDIGGPVGE